MLPVTRTSLSNGFCDGGDRRLLEKAMFKVEATPAFLGYGNPGTSFLLELLCIGVTYSSAS
jgi:hypothetical protein